MSISTFKSNGKLLLTAEYLILDGAIGLALPVKFKQYLNLLPKDNSETFFWKSFDYDNSLWFEAIFETNTFQPITTNNLPIATTLSNILQTAKQMNPAFEVQNNVVTNLDFNKNWGLGSSSTLINNIAQWANVNPFQLLFQTIGGSGYDIACAIANKPITYQLVNKQPFYQTVNFNPKFHQQLYFAYLNKKQKSSDAIAHYKKLKNETLKQAIDNVNLLTQAILACEDLNNFFSILTQHEQIIASCTQQEPIQKTLFNDFEGSIKSLGAWGGDFILIATHWDKTKLVSYMQQKGIQTIFEYHEII